MHGKSSQETQRGFCYNRTREEAENNSYAHKDTFYIGTGGYDGTKLRIYIWMEGTDADCVNNTAADDPAQYSVAVKLAVVATSGN